MSLWQLLTRATRLEKDIKLLDLEDDPVGENKVSEVLILRAVVLLWVF